MGDNLAIWNAVSKTDPKYTKKVNQRGGYTAIGANYQIMCATKQFGPIGIGWGYNVGTISRFDQFIIVPVTFWHGSRENCFGPVLGCAEMFGNRPDSDAPKKAMTDGITKGLSHLGFNADVFLGKFDDQKYVAEMHEEFDERAPFNEKAERDRLVNAVLSQKDIDTIHKLWMQPSFQSILDKLPSEMQNEIAKVRDDCIADINTHKKDTANG